MLNTSFSESISSSVTAADLGNDERVAKRAAAVDASSRPVLDATYIRFLLECQVFVEMIRVGDTDGAFIYANETLGSSAYFGPRFRPHLGSVISLIAYPDPSSVKSATGGPGLLSQARRDELAALVNGWLLSNLGWTADTALERIVRQVCVWFSRNCKRCVLCKTPWPV